MYVPVVNEVRLNRCLTCMLRQVTDDLKIAVRCFVNKRTQVSNFCLANLIRAIRQNAKPPTHAASIARLMRRIFAQIWRVYYAGFIPVVASGVGRHGGSNVI